MFLRGGDAPSKTEEIDKSLALKYRYAFEFTQLTLKLTFVTNEDGMTESFGDLSWINSGILLLIVLTHYGLGKKIIDTGVWATSVVGILIAAIPSAIFCNISAALVKQAILITTSVSSFLTLKYIFFHLKNFRIKTTDLKIFLICTTIALVIFLTNYYYNGQFRSQNGDVLLSYNAHDAYFSSIVIEILGADYFGRTKMLTAFPLEWGNYHFFNAAVIAQLQYFLPKNNLFSYYFSHLMLISIIIAALVEEALRLQSFSFFRVIKTIFFVMVLFTIFGKNSSWNLMTNGSISFLATVMATISWPDRKKIVLWIIFVGFSVSRLIPFSAIALLFLFFENWAKYVSLKPFDIHLQNIKKDVKEHSNFLLLISFLVIYTFFTIYPKYNYLEFVSPNRFHDSWLSPLLFYRLIAELAVFKIHFTNLDIDMYRHFPLDSIVFKIFSLLQVLLGLTTLLACPIYIIKENKKVFIFWALIVLSALLDQDARYMTLLTLFYFSMAYFLIRNDVKLSFVVLAFILTCHFLQLTGVNAIKGPITSIVYDVLLGALVVKKLLTVYPTRSFYAATISLLVGCIVYPLCLFNFKLPEDFAISLNYFKEVKQSFDKSSKGSINATEFLKKNPNLSIEDLAAFSVIYRVPLRHNAQMPTLSTRHARTADYDAPYWFKKLFLHE